MNINYHFNSKQHTHAHDPNLINFQLFRQKTTQEAPFCLLQQLSEKTDLVILKRQQLFLFMRQKSSGLLSSSTSDDHQLPNQTPPPDGTKKKHAINKKKKQIVKLKTLNLKPALLPIKMQTKSFLKKKHKQRYSTTSSSPPTCASQKSSEATKKCFYESKREEGRTQGLTQTNYEYL